ncbi:MAG: hypothetical protein ACLFRP_08420 [Puniceicoccaceae bacterium]
MKAVLAVFPLLLLFAVAGQDPDPLAVVPGLPGLDTVRTSAFPGGTIPVVCHRPAGSDPEPPRARLFVAGSATATPLAADIQWEELPAASDNAPYQSFTADLTLPAATRPVDLLLRISAFPGGGDTGVVRIRLAPRRLPAVFQSLTETRTLWVEEEWTTLRTWLEEADIPHEILPVSVMTFRDGDFLLARLPTDKEERAREIESLSNCPEQLWIDTEIDDPAALRVSQTDALTRVTVETGGRDPFPPRSPAVESLLIKAIAPFLSNQPQPDPESS